MEEPRMTIRVTMMGPSRVGKTTLLTAVLENARDLLAGSPTSIEPADQATQKRLRDNEIELTADLLAGEFRSGSLAGTYSVSTYRMRISPGVPGEGLQLDFVDFPGGLLDPQVRASRAKEWSKVTSFMQLSTALLLPVDAVVLMEARTRDEKRAIPTILGLTDVRKAAEEWAKTRQLYPDQPATAIISPVKCETYFTHHDGVGPDRRGPDRSDELLRKVQDTYSAVIGTIQRDCPHAEIRYCPVQSIGCVELVKPNWQPFGERGLEPDPEFLVLPPGIRHVRGAGDILTPLVRQVILAGKASAADRERHAQEERRRARELADLGFWQASEKFGFWNELLDRANGVRRQREALVQERTLQAGEALRRLEAYEEVMNKIGNCEPGAYVRSL